VVGPGLKKQMLWDLCNRLTTSDPIVLGGTGHERRDWIDVRDVVRVLEYLADHPTKVVNVGTGTATTVREVAQMAAECNGRRIWFSGQSRPGDPFSLVASTELLGLLGYDRPFIPVDKSIADYVAWFTERNRR
jgi:UDP-glucose 4-epimerase